MRFAIMAFAALATFTAPAVAHPEGHDQQFQTERRPVGELAQDAVIKLVTQAKLPAGWAKAKLIKQDLRTKNGTQQWVITFENKAERRRTKRLLHVLMTTDGEFISANHKLS